jgi:hypothetical protein
VVLLAADAPWTSGVHDGHRALLAAFLEKIGAADVSAFFRRRILRIFVGELSELDGFKWTSLYCLEEASLQ